MTKAFQRKALRVAIVCISRSRGGLELMLLKIASALQHRGHRMFFLAPSQSLFEEECRKSNLPFVPLRSTFRYLDMFAALTIARTLRTQHIDILLIGQSKDVSTSILANMFRRTTKLIFLQQMQFGIKKKDPFHRWAYGHLDLWITLTKAMKTSVLENTTVHKDSIRVIPFGVDLSVFRPSVYRKSESREAFGLPERDIIISLIGRFDRQKGQEYLLRAIPAVLKKAPKAHFVLVGEETVGESGYLSELKSLIRTLKIGRHVSFKPFTHDIPRFLSACDLVTVPSFSETFGYVAVEAMAMGIPVIGTNAGGLPEIVVDGKTGLLVPPKDSAALARSILRLAIDSRLRTKLGIASRRRVSKLFDFQKNIGELEKVCSDIHSDFAKRGFDQTGSDTRSFSP